MVVKKAWIPSMGTYSVTLTDNPNDPTLGDLIHENSSPADNCIVGAEKESTPRTRAECLQNNYQLEEFLNVVSLANLAQVHKVGNEWKVRGDPTEIAFQVFASRFDWNRTRLTSGRNPPWAQYAEYPFDSSIKKMSVIFRLNSETAPSAKVFTKGAVERVLDSCRTVVWKNDMLAVELTNSLRREIFKNMEALAASGLRVLALASREWSIKPIDSIPERADVEQDLVFQGLIGLYDPPRTESASAVRQCQRSGIAVHMLTGDHSSTASAIAAQVGILPSNMKSVSKEIADAMVMTASRFDELSDGEIDKLPVLPLVIARCSPTTKVRMIEALHRRSCFVAMTGDGVNDSPSLKRADVGIAMGLAGSDVAKDASDIVLSDDNFASILNAVEEGRRMFDNIQKFVLHLLAENIAQACTLLVGLAFKDKTHLSIFPLSPVEILWVIMVTSGMPDMGLGFEEAAPDIMARPPHSLKQGVFTSELMIDMLVYGLWMAALCLSAFSLVLFGFGDGNLASGCNVSYTPECDTVFRARATTFVCLTWFALFLAWEMINMRRSFFRMKPKTKHHFTQWIRDVWRNKFLFWAIAAGFVTVFPTLYIPVISHDVFKHEGISWEWGIVFVEAILFFTGVELWKWAKRVWFRRHGGRGPKNGNLEEAFEQYSTGMTS
jgi:P-type Na+/K+ transporter